ncbi:MAG: hypothetical protein LBT87_00660 [Treponema sp.]|jgi:hypothetical protein|nr:hypothetical protein [Treponema sp.]
MAGKKETISNLIDSYLENLEGDFYPEDIAGYIKFMDSLEGRKSKKLKNLPTEYFVSLLYGDDRLFSGDNGSLTARFLFFKDLEFIISPTEEEVSGGFLLPGHRFIPFCSSRVMPWQCVLRDGKGREVSTKVIQKKLYGLEIYYSLWGLENLFLLLGEDRETNVEAITGEKAAAGASVDLTVFDFAGLFKEWRFKFGDALRCRTLDWNRGIYSFEYLPEGAGKQNPRWEKGLERGFRKVFGRFALELPVREQIAYAYFFAGKRCLKDPPMALGHFFKKPVNIFYVKFGREYRLWKNEDPDLDFLDDVKRDMDEEKYPPDSLNGILRGLGCIFSDVEVEAFMRDELFKNRGDGKGEYSAALDRLFPDEPPFSSLKQKNTFLKHVRRLWKRVCASYNYFSDQKAGAVRKEILRILENYYAWFDEFVLGNEDLADDEIPLQDYIGLTQTVSMFTGMLNDLNGNAETSAESIDEINETAISLGWQIDEMRAKIETKLASLRAGKKRQAGKGAKIIDWNRHRR